MENNLKKYFYNQDQFIAYDKLNGKLNSQPEIIFLSGFNSNLTGTKAEYLHHYCKEKGYSFTRFDYFGHGASTGNFIEGTIGLWLANTLTVIDNSAAGEVILVGSSMGGWLMLLAALARPVKIKGLLGIAAAPDFTEDLIWTPLKEQDKRELKSKGIINLADDYPECNYNISLNLIEEARNHLLLRDKININCPIYLLHGMLDKDVPYSTSIKLAEQLTSSDVTLKLLKNSDHRMSSDTDLKLLQTTLEELLAK